MRPLDWLTQQCETFYNSKLNISKHFFYRAIGDSKDSGPTCQHSCQQTLPPRCSSARNMPSLVGPAPPLVHLTLCFGHRPTPVRYLCATSHRSIFASLLSALMCSPGLDFSFSSGLYVSHPLAHNRCMSQLSCGPSSTLTVLHCSRLYEYLLAFFLDTSLSCHT